MHGWIILDKPVGLGSTQAVAAVKRALRQGGYGKFKVGHGGTLDPLASGVLPIAVGEATKLAGRLLDSDKIYEFTIRFGEQTDTLDTEGAVVATSDVRPTAETLEAIVPRFIGPIAQVPPAYSALKVDGERAYDLARSGQDVVLATRDVTIYSLHSSPTGGGGPSARADGGGAAADAALLGHPTTVCDGPPPRAGEELEEATLTAHVSKGTYIRSLARDIAAALGTVGHVTMLRRI
ncbi:MAG: tRNA pseudouridine(55) synthase TruB, partial [Pseudomonadota bacterium]|nr:tRNA pseudouridine(55) synthase TruB [Pseudomonadota bacterium]